MLPHLSYFLLEERLEMKLRYQSKVLVIVLIGFCLITEVLAERRFFKRRLFTQPKGEEILTFLDTLNTESELHLIILDSNLLVIPTKKDKKSKSQKKIEKEGYRIQLIASSSIEAMRDKKKEVESKLRLSAYISYDPPFYKLYVGDFISRRSAEKARVKIERKGYPDAWIVKSKILVSKR